MTTTTARRYASAAGRYHSQYTGLLVAVGLALVHYLASLGRRHIVLACSLRVVGPTYRTDRGPRRHDDNDDARRRRTATRLGSGCPMRRSPARRSRARSAIRSPRASASALTPRGTARSALCAAQHRTSHLQWHRMQSLAPRSAHTGEAIPAGVRFRFALARVCEGCCMSEHGFLSLASFSAHRLGGSLSHCTLVCVALRGDPVGEL